MLRSNLRLGAALCCAMLLGANPQSRAEDLSLPISVDAEIVGKGDTQNLVVKVSNRKPFKLAISTDFLKDAQWLVHRLEEDPKGEAFSLKELVSIQSSYISGQNFASRLSSVKNKLKDPAKSVTLEPGRSFSIEIPLANVLQLPNVGGSSYPILAQLQFSGLAVGGSDLTEKESVELFLTRFSLPRLIYRDGVWRKFGKAEQDLSDSSTFSAAFSA